MKKLMFLLVDSIVTAIIRIKHWHWKERRRRIIQEGPQDVIQWAYDDSDAPRTLIIPGLDISSLKEKIKSLRIITRGTHDVNPMLHDGVNASIPESAIPQIDVNDLPNAEGLVAV